MAEIMGFKALKYNTEKAGNLETLICPPYDIISDDERENYILDNQYNIVRLELPKGDDKYKNAGNLLNDWLAQQALIQDDESCIYVYEMEFDAHNQKKSVKGFISLVKLEEFSKGVVLPHEETLSKAKTDRFNLMSETYCNFSQIYSLYMDETGESYSLLTKCSGGNPDLQVEDKDGVIHKIWNVSDQSIIASLKNVFASKKLYIADGHHRYETALNFHKHLVEKNDPKAQSSGYVMMMLVNMENDGLVVFPTHRLIKDLQSFDSDAVIQKCKAYFDIEVYHNLQAVQKLLDAKYHDNQSAFAMYCGNDRFILMTLKDKTAVKHELPNMSDAYCGLDVSVLHTLLLEKVFGIDKENMANQKNLSYTKSMQEAVDSVDKGLSNCSFIMNPTKVSEIRDVALAKEKMPQKSTYFYPKTITGLVINKM